MTIPDPWQLESVKGSTLRIVTETKPYKVVLVGTIKKDDPNLKEAGEESVIAVASDGEVFVIGCGGSAACYGKKFETGASYAIVWDIESTQPVPPNLDGVWSPDHKFTNSDLINIMKSMTQVK